MWMLAGFALLGGIHVIDCPDGTRYAVKDPRLAPCVADCGDGTWIVAGLEECPGLPLPDRQEPRVEFEVKRIWTETGNYANALVTVTNRGSEIWPGGRVQCTALERDGTKINIDDARVDPIAPHGDRDVKVRVGIRGQKMKSMNCRLSWTR